jgi:c-di-GMP-binding flagellar brake protein YcgR
MFEKLIKPGGKVELGASREGAQGFMTKIESVLGDRELRLFTPIVHGRLAMPRLGSRQTIVFFTEDGVIRYDAQVEGYEKQGEASLMRVMLTSAGEKIQRRDFFRFNCSLPAKLIAESQWDEDESIIIDAQLLDIGGGGAKLAVKAELRERSRVKMAVKLDEDYIVVGARVLSCSPMDAGEYKSRCRMQFVGMTDSERESIIQFIFKEQRKALQKR